MYSRNVGVVRNDYPSSKSRSAANHRIFFKGFHSRDSLAIQKVCSDKMGLQSIAENAKGSQFSTDTASKFYKSIASIPNTMQFEERLLGHTIHIDGAMAIDWTPYEFYVNGKKSYSGVNVFTLYKH